MLVHDPAKSTTRPLLRHWTVFTTFPTIALLPMLVSAQDAKPKVKAKAAPHPAFVEIEDDPKFRDYALDPVHEEAKRKTCVFAAALGLSRNDAGWLRDQLLLASKEFDRTLGRKTEHGQRYSIDFQITFRGRTARLRSAWNVRLAENVHRLVTCYVL